MAINRTFLDLGPPKRYQWGPNTWANIIWGQFFWGGPVYELWRSIITSLIYQKSQSLTTNKIWSKIGISKAFLDL